MTGFDLGEYLRRIAYAGTPRPDLATLAALHRAHVAAIPFENLDIQMGGPVKIDAETLQAKLVRQRRGGYCFEHNSLFALSLRAIGFAPETCEARVRHLGADMLPRTHMVLILSVEGREWLADVGFGGDGLIEPIALDGSATEQLGLVYRVGREGPLRVLQRRGADGWQDLYAVQPDPVYPIDYEAANWFTSTHPNSPFVLNLTVQRVTDGARHILRNLTYSIARGADVETREITRAELIPLLRDTFGVDVPVGARFRALDKDQ